jgi:hypothetical protein
VRFYDEETNGGGLQEESFAMHVVCFQSLHFGANYTLLINLLYAYHVFTPNDALCIDLIHPLHVMLLVKDVQKWAYGDHCDGS